MEMTLISARTYRQPCRRRRIRRGQRQDRRPLRPAAPAARRLRDRRHGPAAPPSSSRCSPSSPTGYPAARNRSSPAAWPPSSATLVMTATLSALTCTGFVFLLGASNGEELFGEPTP